MQIDLWHIQYGLHKSILIENVWGGKENKEVCFVFLMFSFCSGWIGMDSVVSGWSKSGEDFFKGMIECIFTDKNSSMPGEGLRLWGDAVFSIPILVPTLFWGWVFGARIVRVSHCTFRYWKLKEQASPQQSGLLEGSRRPPVSGWEHGMRFWKIFWTPSEGVMVQELSGRNFFLLPMSHFSTQHPWFLPTRLSRQWFEKTSVK